MVNAAKLFGGGMALHFYSEMHRCISLGISGPLFIFGVCPPHVNLELVHLAKKDNSTAS